MSQVLNPSKKYGKGLKINHWLMWGSIVKEKLHIMEGNKFIKEAGLVFM